MEGVVLRPVRPVPVGRVTAGRPAFRQRCQPYGLRGVCEGRERRQTWARRRDLMQCTMGMW